MKPSYSQILGLAVIGAVSLALPAHAQIFTGTISNDYGTAGNWSTNTVPNLTTGATALINNGSAVTYNPGGDFVIDNNSTLEISNGSWTQINSNNWIQLAGNGTILVDGGTFNQGSAGNNPFNISNTGNSFTITSGAANFNGSLASTQSGVTYNFNGGVTTIGGEIDYNNNNNLLFNGGTVNASALGPYSTSTWRVYPVNPPDPSVQARALSAVFAGATVWQLPPCLLLLVTTPTHLPPPGPPKNNHAKKFRRPSGTCRARSRGRRRRC